MIFIRSDNYHFMTHDIHNLSPPSKLAACVIQIIITLTDTVEIFLWNCLQIVKIPATKAYFVGTYLVAKTWGRR